MMEKMFPRKTSEFRLSNRRYRGGRVRQGERGDAVYHEDTAVLQEICMHLEMYNAKLPHKD